MSWKSGPYFKLGVANHPSFAILECLTLDIYHRNHTKALFKAFAKKNDMRNVINIKCATISWEFENFLVLFLCQSRKPSSSKSSILEFDLLVSLQATWYLRK